MTLLVELLFVWGVIAALVWLLVSSLLERRHSPLRWKALDYSFHAFMALGLVVMVLYCASVTIEIIAIARQPA